MIYIQFLWIKIIFGLPNYLYRIYRKFTVVKNTETFNYNNLSLSKVQNYNTLCRYLITIIIYFILKTTGIFLNLLTLIAFIYSSISYIDLQPKTMTNYRIILTSRDKQHISILDSSNINPSNTECFYS